MALQARAEVTRQAIIEAAVDLFEEVGYGSTDLTAIINRAGVTKGAFYYHFPTKEAVAAAIIEHENVALEDTVRGTLSAPAPTLENLICASFTVADLTRRDSRVRVGHLLRQAVGQVSGSGQSAFDQRRSIIVSAVETAIAEGDVGGDIDPQAVGHTIWASLLGTHLLSAATGEDIFARLAQSWAVILRGIVPTQSAPYFEQFVTRLTQQYTQPNQDASLLNPIDSSRRLDPA